MKFNDVAMVARIKVLHVIVNRTKWNYLLGHFPTLLVLIILCFIGWFLVVRIGAYLDFPPALFRDPEILNLTTNKTEWDVYYGQSEKCGDIDCFLTAKQPDSSYQKKMILPAREFPLVGYKDGQIIYLRARLRLPDYLLDKPALVLHTLLIFAKHYEVYVNETLIEEGDTETLLAEIPKTLYAKDPNILISMKIDPGHSSLQGVANRGDLLIGEKSKIRPQLFASFDRSSNMYLWFLLPRITFCMMFAFFYLTIFRSREIFAFVLYAFLGALELYFRSSYPSSMIPVDIRWNFIAMICRNFSIFALIGFAAGYFRHAGRNLYRLIWLGVAVQIIFVCLSYTVFPFQVANTIIDLIIVILKPLGIFTSLWLSLQTIRYLRQNPSGNIRLRAATLLSLIFSAWLVLAFVESGDVVRELLGNNTSGVFRKTWLLDLLFFFVLAAITAIEIGASVANQRAIEAELRAHEERLALARSVQDLLLPESLAGRHAANSYQFFYEPAQKMSGDWLNVWRTDDECRLFFGDVVGKGPQAALAVAAIAAAISECRQQNFSMSKTIECINNRLYDLFKAKVSSTFTAAVIRNDMDVDLYNCGAQGWLLFNGSAWQVVDLRGSSLGQGPSPSVGHRNITLSPGSGLVAFTDGCLEGSRSLKRLFREFAKQNTQPSSHNEVWQRVLEVGAESVFVDDRTLLVISHSRPTLSV